MRNLFYFSNVNMKQIQTLHKYKFNRNAILKKNQISKKFCIINCIRSCNNNSLKSIFDCISLCEKKKRRKKKFSNRIDLKETIRLSWVEEGEVTIHITITTRYWLWYFTSNDQLFPNELFTIFKSEMASLRIVN